MKRKNQNIQPNVGKNSDNDSDQSSLDTVPILRELLDEIRSAELLRDMRADPMHQKRIMEIELMRKESMRKAKEARPTI